ncbi:MAG: hypothetical protein ABI831_21495 [Betaproteobacteria bacterium]
MEPEDFEAVLNSIGWSHSEFARQSGLTLARVSSYATGDHDIPAWVENYLAMMAEINGGQPVSAKPS